MRRPRRLQARPPRLTMGQILSWADDHFARTGSWPNYHSGKVTGSLHENWRKIHNALYLGLRGLPGGTSLAQLLQEERGVRNIQNLPDYSLRQILAWADAYHHRTGGWPDGNAGPIPEAPGETWKAVAMALVKGGRGLPAGSSLARVLGRFRGRPNLHAQPPLTVAQILTWADHHYQRTGQWPKLRTGAVLGATGETWARLDGVLRTGRRGLPGGSSLARLLEQERGVRNVQSLPALTTAQIISWAQAHHGRTGAWPTAGSGPLAQAPGETWCNLDAALRAGTRNLPGGSSLAQLLRGLEGPEIRR